MEQPSSLEVSKSPMLDSLPIILEVTEALGLYFLTQFESVDKETSQPSNNFRHKTSFEEATAASCNQL